MAFESTDDVGGVLRPHLGREIQRIRTDSRVSQERLAREAGLDPGTLARLERGEAPVREEDLLSICRALEVDLDDLFDYLLSSFEREQKASRASDPADPLLDLIRKTREKIDSRVWSDRELLDLWCELLRQMSALM